MLCGGVAIWRNETAERSGYLPRDKVVFEARVVQSSGQGGVMRTMNSLPMCHDSDGTSTNQLIAANVLTLMTVEGRESKQS